YDRAARQLRRASRAVSRRQGPDRRTGHKPSKRWEKANTARNRIHHRTANLREDALHKLTTIVAAQYGTVVVEDLNGAGTRQRHATSLVVADRWYPSSKTCSGCGVAKAKLALHVRTFHCEACGLVLDRDANAARNLAALAAACTTGTAVAGDRDTPKQVSKPRGADHKTRTTRPRRKTGTGRAGGTTLPHQRQTETRDRTQTEALTLW
ncbi:zinc ribbon domain-containing protein, partial [Streptomyces sp. NPDC002573]|uniref:zinc ribbon domain-containing protein n=1 Tax=Streptomyces sp. NPDC002573 TaxID=3364651 RepID=UPI0036B947B0